MLLYIGNFFGGTDIKIGCDYAMNGGQNHAIKINTNSARNVPIFYR